MDITLLRNPLSFPINAQVPFASDRLKHLNTSTKYLKIVCMWRHVSDRYARDELLRHVVGHTHANDSTCTKCAYFA